MPKDHYWVLVLCTALLFWYTAQLNCTNGTTVVTCLAVRIEPILGLEHTYYIQTACIHTCINTLYEYEYKYEYEARKNVQINQHSVGAVKNCLSYNVKKKIINVVKCLCFRDFHSYILTLAVSSPALPAIDLSAFRSSLISGFRGWVTKKKLCVRI